MVIINFDIQTLENTVIQSTGNTNVNIGGGMNMKKWCQYITMMCVFTFLVFMMPQNVAASQNSQLESEEKENTQYLSGNIENGVVAASTQENSIVKSVKITKLPDQTTFYAKETIVHDIRGMKCTVYFNDGTSYKVVVDDDDDPKIDLAEATVFYHDEEDTLMSKRWKYETNGVPKKGKNAIICEVFSYEFEVPVTVVAYPIKSVTCLKEPDCVNHFVGNYKYDLYGGKFKIKFTDGTQKTLNIKKHTYDGYAFYKDGKKFEMWAYGWTSGKKKEVLRVTFSMQFLYGVPYTDIAVKSYSYTYEGLKYKLTEDETAQVVGYATKKSKLESVKIPKYVTILGEKYAVTKIKQNTFKGCTKLKTVTIGNNINKIGNSAFEKCTSLTEIIIPANVKILGTSVFKSCKKLKNITFETKKLTKVGANALKGINSKAKIKVPAAKLDVYKELLKGKGQGSKVKIYK